MKTIVASGIPFGSVYSAMSRSWLGQQGPESFDFGQYQSRWSNGHRSIFGGRLDSMSGNRNFSYSRIHSGIGPGP